MNRRGRALLQGLVPWLMLLVLGGLTAFIVAGYLDTARKGQVIVWHHKWAGLLGLAGGLVAWAGFHLHRQRAAALGFSRQQVLTRVRPGARVYLAPLPTVIRILVIGLLAVALARPRTYRIITHEIDSVDIVIVLDLSKSMEESDLPRDRLDAAQRVIRRFVNRRGSDRIGLVVFAQEAMLQCPLTLDMKLLDRIVANLMIGDVPEYGTAIGDGLALGLLQLKRSDAKSKIVILLSDGDSNVASQYEPDTAAELAKKLGVRVFTMLIGAEESGLFGTTVDPETLKGIAEKTGGEFFPAVDQDTFERSFQRVREDLDKTRRVTKERVPDRELFLGLAMAALVLLLIERALSATWLRRWP